MEKRKRKRLTIRFVACEALKSCFAKFSEKFRNWFQLHWWKTLGPLEVRHNGCPNHWWKIVWSQPLACPFWVSRVNNYRWMFIPLRFWRPFLGNWEVLRFGKNSQMKKNHSHGVGKKSSFSWEPRPRKHEWTGCFRNAISAYRTLQISLRILRESFKAKTERSINFRASLGPRMEKGPSKSTSVTCFVNWHW